MCIKYSSHLHYRRKRIQNNFSNGDISDATADWIQDKLSYLKLNYIILNYFFKHDNEKQ